MVCRNCDHNDNTFAFLTINIYHFLLSTVWKNRCLASVLSSKVILRLDGRVQSQPLSSSARRRTSGTRTETPRGPDTWGTAAGHKRGWWYRLDSFMRCIYSGYKKSTHPCQYQSTVSTKLNGFCHITKKVIYADVCRLFFYIQCRWDTVPCSWGCLAECAARPVSRFRWWVWGTGRACPDPPRCALQWCRCCCSAACLTRCLKEWNFTFTWFKNK